MVDTTTAPVGRAGPMSLAARFAGVITSPKSTFEAIAAHPRWLGMLVLVTAIITAGAVLPITSEAGKEATLRSQVEGMESFGMTVSDEAYEGMRRGMGIAPYTTAAAVLVFTPLMTLVLAGILFAVFSATGGDATFRQVFTVMVHASVISALQGLFTGPVNYFRGAVTSATNLAVFLPMVDDRSFLGRILAMTDLFLIWYVLVLAIGLGVLYRRKTTPIALALYGFYAVVVLVFAAVMSRMGAA